MDGCERDTVSGLILKKRRARGRMGKRQMKKMKQKSISWAAAWPSGRTEGTSVIDTHTNINHTL